MINFGYHTAMRQGMRLLRELRFFVVTPLIVKLVSMVGTPALSTNATV